MYEVTYSIDGIIKKIYVPASDTQAVFEAITNMFSGTRYEIINVVRKSI